MIERFDVGGKNTNPIYVKFAEEHRLRYRLAKSMIPDGGMVIDAACGCGYGSEYWEDYVGVDIDVNEAVANYPSGNFVEGDLEKVSFWNALGQVDHVVCLETAEHLQCPVSFLKMIYEHLPKGGKLIFSAPTSLTKDFDPYHLRDWDANKWSLILRSVGFKIEERVSMPFEGKFTDLFGVCPTTWREKWSILSYNLTHWRYGSNRIRYWLLQNRFQWCSTLFHCTR